MKSGEHVMQGVLAAMVLAFWFPAWGELVRWLKDHVWNRDEREFDSMAKRLAADLSAAGGYGVMSDYAQAGSDAGRAAKRLVGPTISSKVLEPAQIMLSDRKDTGEKMKDMGRWAVKNFVPFGGPAQRWLMADQ
jgi:hypothetical protein